MLELSMGWISSISHWFYQLRLRKVVDRWFVFYCALFVVLFCEFLALFGSLPVVAEDRSVGIVDGEMFCNMFIVVTWLKFSANLPALVASIQYVFA